MNLPGSVHHLTGELINVEAGTSMRGIPYRGNTQIVQDLLGGRLDVMVETGTVAFAQIKGGTLRGLAVSSRERFALEPRYPGDRRDASRASRSCPGSASPMPAGIPRPIVDRLNREIGEILKLADIREKLAGVGNVPTAVHARRNAATISSATPPAGAGSSSSRRSSGIDGLSHLHARPRAGTAGRRTARLAAAAASARRPRP